MYQLTPETPLGPANSVKRLSDNAFIPFDTANAAYQEYLDWLDEGNEPLPADEPPEQIDEENVLTPRRFRWMVSINGWREVWDTIEAWAAVNDPATAALLYAQTGAKTYQLSETLRLLALMKPLTDAQTPDVDLSEETVRQKWAEAKNASL